MQGIEAIAEKAVEEGSGLCIADALRYEPYGPYHLGGLFLPWHRVHPQGREVAADAKGASRME